MADHQWGFQSHSDWFCPGCRCTVQVDEKHELPRGPCVPWVPSIPCNLCGAYVGNGLAMHLAACPVDVRNLRVREVEALELIAKQLEAIELQLGGSTR